MGVELDISKNKLHQFEVDYRDDSGRQLIEIIDHWLHNSNDLSWRRLSKAMKRVGGHANLVSRLNELDNSCLPQMEDYSSLAIGMSTYLFKNGQLPKSVTSCIVI